ncbi:ABC transporter substrate-binding protein [Rhodoplanes sp. Z2-YC6860]|uniref:ABC transporter substrate-binding protein n=1 Tax=Rhodoplanes sp. Z2-YC6860 TaxID=674703 RepID=UPI00078BA1F2|nr:ABC transporter substrate-binding protein [Rhodoplanes sp. Z2-YC6860]AMN42144.1 ABC transporter substrate binding protein [Rhodoplanes sp. Z2-YC6860]
MRRRTFLALLGSAAWPCAASAQQSDRARRIGILMGGSEHDSQAQAGLAALRDGLKKLGWTEGQNVTFDIRWSQADLERMKADARTLVASQPDLVVTHTTQPTAALQRETKTIPIVFLIVSDPVGSGFVSSLPRPGGNITGFINLEASLGGKWIELLKEIVPDAKRAALMFNPDTATYSKYYLDPFVAAARVQGIEATAAPVHNAGEIENAVTALAGQPNTGLVVMPDAFTAVQKNRDLAISLAARLRLPVIYPYRYFVADGGLISYGIDQVDLYRRAPAYIDRILKGAKPSELPVQLPTRFELVVNMKTAKALGINIPATLLARADEAIE